MWNFTRFTRAAAWITLGGMLILTIAAHPFSSTSGEPNPPGHAVQITDTPQPQDESEIGSTDGIVALGLLIGIIVLTPILLQRKSWSKN